MSKCSSEIIFKDESFLNEDKNVEWPDEDPIYSKDIEIKCGEIVLIANTKFCFICTFCDERFNSVLIFRNHIKGIHIADAENVPCTEDKNPLDVPLNENQIIMKLETDLNYNSNEESSNLIPRINIGNSDGDESIWESNNEGQGCVINSQFDFDKIGDVISKKTLKIENSNKNQKAVNSISKPTHENAPKTIPKKRNRKKKVYSCLICQYIARDKKSLEAHLQSKHGTGTRHQCEECGKCFRSANNLKSHLVIHSGTRPYKCDSCDSDFSHSNSLKMHRYIHSGERPHKCNQCGKGFVSTSGLKTHLREHTGEIPYVCQFCERGFASKCSYNRHLISHSGRRAHECQQCKKTFAHKETLTKHMVCHTNEKKFVCDICSKKFNHKKNLVQHEKLHLNIKQYICKICSKDFAQYAGLYSHMKYHKNKEYSQLL